MQSKKSVYRNFITISEFCARSSITILGHDDLCIQNFFSVSPNPEDDTEVDSNSSIVSIVLFTWLLCSVNSVSLHWYLIFFENFVEAFWKII